MLPTREEALKLIRDGLLFNPGPWGKHCLTAAHCAEKIARARHLLYESLGFTECGRIPNANRYDDGAYSDDILMGLQI